MSPSQHYWEDKKTSTSDSVTAVLSCLLICLVIFRATHWHAETCVLKTRWASRGRSGAGAACPGGCHQLLGQAPGTLKQAVAEQAGCSLTAAGRGWLPCASLTSCPVRLKGMGKRQLCRQSYRCNLCKPGSGLVYKASQLDLEPLNLQLPEVSRSELRWMERVLAACDTLSQSQVGRGWQQVLHLSLGRRGCPRLACMQRVAPAC